MLNLSLAGTLGRDAEYKESQNGRGRCQFSVAVNIGFADKKVTHWIDVTSWGEGSRGLSNILRKGSKVAVTGELSTREHNGKTYLQCRADNVTILGTPGDAPRQPVDPNNAEFRKEFAPQRTEMDEEIPF